MRTTQLTPEERETLDRLTGEILDEARALRASGGRHSLNERLAADCRLVDGYLEVIYREMEKLGVSPACRAGCDYCCHMNVHVAEAEAFHLAAHVERSDKAAVLKEAVVEAARTIRGKTDEDRFREHIACPFLDRDTGRCQVYEARPFICRTHNSTSRLGCRKAFRAGSPTGAEGARVGAIRKAIVLGAVARHGYIAGAAQAGLVSQGVELTQALAAIFSTDAAEERWAKGEDIFAAFRTAPVTRAVEAV